MGWEKLSLQFRKVVGVLFASLHSKPVDLNLSLLVSRLNVCIVLCSDDSPVLFYEKKNCKINVSINKLFVVKLNSFVCLFHLLLIEYLHAGIEHFR